MMLAHIAGIPVEESFVPLAAAFMFSGAWLTARLRQPRRARARHNDLRNEDA